MVEVINSDKHSSLSRNGYTNSYITTPSGLYYEHTTIVNDDTSSINKFETSLTDDARVIIYDRHMFILHATGVNFILLF